MVDFQAGKNSSTFSVPIINGSEIESPENFELELYIPINTSRKGVAKGKNDTALVKIIEGMKLLSMNIHVHEYSDCRVTIRTAEPIQSCMARGQLVLFVHVQ